MDIKWVQLEVKSLFIKLLLEKAIKFDLKKVYNEKKIETSIPKSILKNCYSSVQNRYISLLVMKFTYSVMLWALH